MPELSPALFPSFVREHSVRLEPADELDPQARFPGISLPASLALATRKRQTQFLAGRYCARHALAQLDPDLAAAEIAIGPTREPLWPAGIVGTVTHTSSYASAAVAWASNATGLGLDIEELVPPEPDVRSYIATSSELARLAQTVAWDEAWILTTAFSAKESLYKCLFPRVGRYFDFLDAVVTEIDVAHETVTVQLLATLSSEFRAGFTLKGRFRRDVGTVSTAMILLA